MCACMYGGRLDHEATEEVNVGQGCFAVTTNPAL